MRKRKVSQEQLEEFRTEFNRYAKMFGLDGYNIYFKTEELGATYADIAIYEEAMTAITRVNKSLTPLETDNFDPKKCAKHEAIHLLVGRLSELADKRFTSEDEINSATEELVNKLGVLIP